MIKSKWSLVAFACLALSACSLGASADIPSAPAAVADQTAIDEQTALSFELAYQAAGLAVSTAVDAGIIEGETAEKVAALDRSAYAAVLAVRAAYDAGNAASYAQAADIARSRIAAVLAELR